MGQHDFQAIRDRMVDEQLIARGIDQPRLLEAMRKVPRHLFVPSDMRIHAYDDHPLPIGEKQTISQPFIVALMTQMLSLEGTERVLEIGTGCGYQTAILCELANYVYSLERYPLLADRAGARLTRLGYENVDIHLGDGSQGLADMEPYDAILVTAVAPSIPGPLASQLNPDGGRMVLPVGDAHGQHLYIVRRFGDSHHVEKTIAVRFVPLIGRYGFKRSEQSDREKNPEEDGTHGDPPAEV